MSEFKYEFKNLCKSGQYHYLSAKVLFVDQFLDLLKNYGYVYITVPSKCREVMMNNIWPEREQVIIEQIALKIPMLVMEPLVPLSL